MSTSQRFGFITLLCKDTSHADNLNNWRPVSLLNVDYKIISKSFANRLRQVLSDVVNIDQTCSVPGRSIVDNVHLLRNAYDYCYTANVPCIFVSYDQAKAYDKVSHEYLFKVLSAFGFGDSFIRWVSLFYTDISSRVIVNGYLSEAFRILRSLRQGCGLSALLYVLCIEPLANKIRLSTDIIGLRLPGTALEARVSLYADDTTTLASDVYSVRTAIDIFDRFGSASGATLNKDKCAALVVGGAINTADLPRWLPVKDSVKICGVHFGRNVVKLNEDMIYAKMSAATRLHKARALTLRGKVTIINVVICAKMWYVGTCVNFSTEFITRVERLLFNFLEKVHWVNRLTLVLPPIEGGLGINHVKSRLAALRGDHLRQLLVGSQAKWQYFAAFWAGLSLRRWAPRLASNFLPHSEWQPEYYLAALNEFRKIFGDPLGPDPLGLKVKATYRLHLKQAALKPRCIAATPTINFNATWRALNCFDLDPRARDVMWRLAHNVLPVRAFLYRIHITTCTACPLCHTPGVWETAKHLFISCPVTLPVWQYLIPCIARVANSPLPLTDANVLYLNFPASLGSQAAAILGRLYSELIYAVWIKRNAVVFERKQVSSQDVKLLFLYRLRVRLRADFLRLDAARFNDSWQGVASVTNSNLDIKL